MAAAAECKRCSCRAMRHRNSQREETAMQWNRISITVLATGFIALFGVASAGADIGDKSPPAAKSGTVDFPVSCGAAAQKKINEAVWILHSFWYDEAVKAFTSVTAIEPDCAMGYWGVAMSHWYPLWYPPNAASLKAGAEAVDKAVAAKQKTARESDYITAIATFYRDNDK